MKIKIHLFAFSALCFQACDKADVTEIEPSEMESANELEGV
ncbi:MAG: hypothetical protein ACI86M_002593 [Saprospiraceae bacterium]|jgi:hypothetical protein